MEKENKQKELKNKTISEILELIKENTISNKEDIEKITSRENFQSLPKQDQEELKRSLELSMARKGFGEFKKHILNKNTEQKKINDKRIEELRKSLDETLNNQTQNIYKILSLAEQLFNNKDYEKAILEVKQALFMVTELKKRRPNSRETIISRNAVDVKLKEQEKSARTIRSKSIVAMKKQTTGKIRNIRKGNLEIFNEIEIEDNDRKTTM